jgi:hypothetical protein
MFCDLVGSTAMSAGLDPEDMRSIIGAYHRCCATLIAGGGGFVAKYMGDGVLAYFGYPQAHEHDAEHAVRAGLAIVEAAPKLDTPAGAPLHVLAPRRSAPTPAADSKTIRPPSRPLCLRTHSSTSPIAAMSSSTHSSAQARPLIAAEKTGRVCHGVELDPLYVDVIVRRYEAATGDAATLIETGETFQALSARRSSEAAPV